MSASTSTRTAAAPDPVSSDLIGSGVEGGVGDQINAWLQRVRSGDMGALPAVGGLVLLAVLFGALSPYFFTAVNFANLMNQAASLVVLGMALVFVLLLGEIDLSAGVTGGVGMAAFVVLNVRFDIPWPIALAAGFGVGLLTGALIGFLVARVGIPSFVVTLGLFLGYQGLTLMIIGAGGLYPIQAPEIIALQNGRLPVWGGWVMLAVMLLISGGMSFWDRARRRRAGVPNRPIALVWAKLAVIAVLGGIAVLVLNLNRSQSVIPVEGVPIIVPVVLAVLFVGTFVLDRTKFGRYVYAIGGNAEAARRAGIKVRWVKWWCFVIASGLAVLSLLFAQARIGSVDGAVGRDIVLSGVAAAVVGGVSLFGGRGRLVHAAIGALVIAVIINGLGLLRMDAGVNLLVTGGVLILAATVDALSRLRAGGVRS
ncbi:ABC transporter permease [Microbacterium sp. EYE_5]|uniref:sugar ABC transporter permease n=1 Tax=unclassified Microbacterium TaxID=2609290 RepID=UPI002004E57F|nr:MULTISPECIES: ABC transporter permease [unclassified Microbacterium]MCK6081185.1 ABC transporter permease [Microbacterium sp. EYE_382]MCK6086455.1 ABC transporter permease [Microbacterium sp. EYE_384]MCK6124047.1 ABC transporter permease [Microbacterium sp. EYE_80]MCK6126956.1 ABC transporter permease [Microbacterium sp. EYE_79]MCK6142140.1 ABC transporter permease [Microbacterium sp. EYE_39]